MPKVTITKADGQRIEITDLSFEEIKELVGANGHTGRSPTRHLRSSALIPVNQQRADYASFKNSLTTKGRQFLALLSDSPNGINSDRLCQVLGFNSGAQLGGMAGGGIGKI